MRKVESWMRGAHRRAAKEGELTYGGINKDGTGQNLRGELKAGADTQDESRTTSSAKKREMEAKASKHASERVRLPGAAVLGTDSLGRFLPLQLVRSLTSKQRSALASFTTGLVACKKTFPFLLPWLFRVLPPLCSERICTRPAHHEHVLTSHPPRKAHTVVR